MNNTNYLDKLLVKEEIEKTMISLQEESSTKWSSSTERKIYLKALEEVEQLLIRLGLGDEE